MPRKGQRYTPEQRALISAAMNRPEVREHCIAAKTPEMRAAIAEKMRAENARRKALKKTAATTSAQSTETVSPKEQ